MITFATEMPMARASEDLDLSEEVGLRAVCVGCGCYHLEGGEAFWSCFVLALALLLLCLALLLLCFCFCFCFNFSLTSRFEQWSQVMTTRVAPTSTQMYFALLHLHPVRVNVSFTIVGRNAAAASGGGGQADKGSGAGASGGGPSGGGSVLWVGDMCVWGGSKCRLVIFDCCVYVFSFHLLIAIVPFPRRRAAAKRRAVGRRPARWRRCSRRWGCRWSRLMRRR